MTSVIDPVLEFLYVPTPRAWQCAAVAHLPELLVDHANCEKKAASNAIALTYRYVEHPHLLQKMSRLAREEL
ncbi:MAG: tRNA isopentenyl-2-thiomethyl-A-37 hydroxylase MiaE, partial [Pseudomonadota bacterium]|nr:tRNA isopentenyl-2-thiomethyl-A-37 hydroxylase MiaE [Pseudomonadota bacterium]